jgi:hypothetical protein
MSWKATAWVNKLTGITRSEKLLMFVLSDRYNEDDHYARPSIPRMAAEALMSQRTVFRTLSSLVKKGIIKIIEHPGRVNFYLFIGHSTPDKMAGVESEPTPDKNSSTPDTGVTPPLTQLCHTNRKGTNKKEPIIPEFEENTENAENTDLDFSEVPF